LFATITPTAAPYVDELDVFCESDFYFGLLKAIRLQHNSMTFQI
jgi:hypothetical protein